ncbi:DUF4268 domain-containing protein [Pimelobacter simplex]|uniref:DUF4268 domain-containing protein n=1 Tax=Nocardioides simplex TaxID=2045 RepID=UPI00214F671E|nr:DUF4268 domain-containing protein [Pimelobacter simplex]UUW87500.1 DUF4268 domain-containing protein [Pimelobacter simplex]UUW97006.1 DUF4268 domain-containing protein [Pimelobacter simplex]
MTTVPAREVWPHEAHDFTPWLLGNVDVLSDLLGMDLVLEVAEHPVGGFSLDLLGRDEASGRTVIVENQLEASDHTHLGQILTYAAGTDPSTIVWVTTGFRPEHRAAIDWLNEHTDEDTRFFGVEIKVVRIGDSEPAPAFDMVAQPNDWGKQVKAATHAGTGLGTGDASGRGRLYWDFWEEARTRIQAEHPGWSRARTSTVSSWFNMALGTTGVVVSMAFTRSGLVTQIYFDSPDAALNLRRFTALRERREAFDSAVGVPVVWDEMEGRKAAKVYVMSDYADIGDVDQWPAMLDWLIDTQQALRSALDTVGGVPSGG